jgi:poly-gamma-glutamate synthesis protein (capsule biosynthesis protein)
MPRRTLPAFLALALSVLAFQKEARGQESAPSGEAPPEPLRIRIVATGDLIPHQTVLDAAALAAASSIPYGLPPSAALSSRPEASPAVAAPIAYEFDSMFRDVRAILASATLAIGNFETVMTGDGSYSGYPSFDSPPSFARALAAAGFDAAVTANNHLLDQGAAGLEGNISILRREGIAVAGTRLAGEPRYVLLDAGGAVVALIAYTYAETRNGAIAFNGTVPPPGLLDRINYFSPAAPGRALAEFAAAATEARSAGARLVIAFVHWGEEYETVPRQREKDFAAALAAGGADLVLGSHPHVVQPVEYVRRPDGALVPVFYSLGNFLSNQRRDTVDNRLTENGLIASIEFDVPAGSGNPRLVSVGAVPTWVNKTQAPKLAYEVVPLSQGYKDLLSMADPLVLADAEAAISQTAAILGAGHLDRAASVFVFPPELPSSPPASPPLRTSTPSRGVTPDRIGTPFRTSSSAPAAKPSAPASSPGANR